MPHRGPLRLSSLARLLALVAAAALVCRFASVYPVLAAVVAVMVPAALALAALLRRAGYTRAAGYYFAILLTWVGSEAYLIGPAETLPYLLAYALAGAAVVGIAWVLHHRPRPSRPARPRSSALESSMPARDGQSS